MQGLKVLKSQMYSKKQGNDIFIARLSNWFMGIKNLLLMVLHYNHIILDLHIHRYRSCYLFVFSEYCHITCSIRLVAMFKYKLDIQLLLFGAICLYSFENCVPANKIELTSVQWFFTTFYMDYQDKTTSIFGFCCQTLVTNVLVVVLTDENRKSCLKSVMASKNIDAVQKLM